MRPIILKGHSRPLTEVLFNREGDLIFTAGKDKVPCVWRTSDGERLGTFGDSEDASKGHNGAVFHIDVNADSTRVITGSGDMSAKLWDCTTGQLLHTYPLKAACRAVNFSADGDRVLIVMDKAMKQQATIFVFAHNRDGEQPTEAEVTITGPPARLNRALFSNFDKEIISVCDDGSLYRHSAEDGQELQKKEISKKPILNMRLSRDRTAFITANYDNSADLFDVANFEQLKHYQSDRKINAVAVHPTKNNVMIGGGQEARDVTTTGAQSGRFEVQMFHTIYQDLMFQCKGHFGPVNSVDISPDGKSFVSGGEDGYVRLYHFDSTYLDEVI